MTITQKLKEKIRELYNQRVSKSEIAIRLKVSRPVVIEACKEVDKMKKAIPDEINHSNEDKIAAKVFKLFRAGNKPDEVVIILKQKPEIIMKLNNQWIEMTDLASEKLQYFLKTVSRMGCERCGISLQTTAIVIGQCTNCNHAIFFGDMRHLGRLSGDIIYINLKANRQLNF